ncbi:hypothetical protein LINGRAHAP2_LOCUS5899, partial [Linum grandiflorum]
HCHFGVFRILLQHHGQQQRQRHIPSTTQLPSLYMIIMNNHLLLLCMITSCSLQYHPAATTYDCHSMIRPWIQVATTPSHHRCSCSSKTSVYSSIKPSEMAT